jgi:hypothetical protein
VISPNTVGGRRSDEKSQNIKKKRKSHDLTIAIQSFPKVSRSSKVKIVWSKSSIDCASTSQQAAVFLVTRQSCPLVLRLSPLRGAPPQTIATTKNVFHLNSAPMKRR